MSPKILLVDDDRDVVRLMAILLQRNELDARVAGGPEEAIAVASEYAPDVICLDLGMPGMNGYELACRLRDIEPMSNVVIIAISGYGPDKKLLEAAGIDKHMLKPVGIQDLLVAICEALLARQGLQKAESERS